MNSVCYDCPVRKRKAGCGWLIAMANNLHCECWHPEWRNAWLRQNQNNNENVKRKENDNAHKKENKES